VIANTSNYSVFQIFRSPDRDFNFFLVAGAMFGMFMTFSVFFDYFLLHKVALRWLFLFTALLGAFMVSAWYIANVFVVSSVISRLGWSVLFNGRLPPALVQDNLTTLGLLAFLVGITVLPLTGYIASL
jgi:hypothetical protein